MSLAVGVSGLQVMIASHLREREVRVLAGDSRIPERLPQQVLKLPGAKNIYKGGKGGEAEDSGVDKSESPPSVCGKNQA